MLGNNECKWYEYNQPTVDPNTKVGVKTPPTAPDPTTISVANNFKRSNCHTKLTDSCWFSKFSITACPFPHTSGISNEITPTANPPKAKLMGKGKFTFWKSFLICSRKNRKTGDKKPTTSPNPKTGNTSTWIDVLNAGKVNIGLMPIQCLIVIVATTAETIKGPNTSIEIDCITISAIKTAPANGVLYAEANPAAHPQATNSLNFGFEKLKKRPILDANRADICTIPPSRPTEAPELIDNNEDNNFIKVGLIEITPSPSRMTSKYSCDRIPLNTFTLKRSTNPAKKPPTVGIKTRISGVRLLAMATISIDWPVNKYFNKIFAWRNRNVEMPPTKPINAAHARVFLETLEPKTSNNLILMNNIKLYKIESTYN